MYTYKSSYLIQKHPFMWQETQHESKHANI